MAPTAFVFPGQGSQYAGMGLDLYEKFPEAREVFDAADAALEFPLSRLCFEGPEEELRMTENTQPGILTVSVAAYRVLEARGVRPDFVAGHSLGEYSAAVASGILSLREAVITVRRRGRYMQEAVPVGTGTMAAILGLDSEALQRVCDEAAQGQVVSAANFNSPGQIVIAGHTEAVDRAGVLARKRGAKRAIPLPVSAPFHCALMMPAQERLKDDLQRLVLNDPRCGLINNVDAALITRAEDFRLGLVRQVSSPVRWQHTMEKMFQLGVKIFVELGPGRVLSGMLRKFQGEFRSYAGEDAAGLEHAIQELGGATPAL